MFGMGPHKLLCAWHVDREWRGAVNRAKKRYGSIILRVLMKESDIKTLLQKAIK